MDLISAESIKNLFRNHQIYPSKGLGQNFLINKPVFEKIIRAADLSSKDTILEIGPGIGNLTQELAKNAKKIISIEKDKIMVGVLKETLKDFKNVEIIQGDILKIKIPDLKIKGSYKVVANLPYYITSPTIRKFLESPGVRPDEVGPRPGLMVLMVQKEVAKRICARPPQMNLLAVSVQFYGEPKIIDFVSKESFWPKPKVDSAILRITPLIRSDKTINVNLFFKVVRAGFSQPRKQLVNNFVKKLALSPPNGLKLNKDRIKFWLSKNKIDPTQRAETLSIAEWLNLVNTFENL